MDGATISPAVSLAIALIGASGLVLGPVLVALIHRGPKALVTDELDPDKVMPREEYEALVDHYARSDAENDRLSRENTRLREQLERERMEHAVELAAAIQKERS